MGRRLDGSYEGVVTEIPRFPIENREVLARLVPGIIDDRDITPEYRRWRVEIRKSVERWDVEIKALDSEERKALVCLGRLVCDRFGYDNLLAMQQLMVIEDLTDLLARRAITIEN